MSPHDAKHPSVGAFFHADTGTFSYVVHHAGSAVVIDPVLDYDAAAARTDTTSADQIAAFVQDRQLSVAWILETHAHADHLSAGNYLRDKLGAPLAIGRKIVGVQAHFKALFDLGNDFTPDGNQFDRLLDENDALPAGDMVVRMMATPGHTEDGLTYLIGDAAFIGDTLFAPDIGTARCDFPGGDATLLYHSIQKILSLPTDTRIFLCHDYPPAGRTQAAETSITAQRENNVHVGHGTAEADFVAMRRARDAGLAVPRLILPALQVNIRAGRLPNPDENGAAFLKLPLNRMGRQT
jgi:glyoxylase-like metal-dependent hydrolase (beta-lactamase superfamily II)